MRQHLPQPYEPLLIGWIAGGMVMMQHPHNRCEQLLTGLMGV